MAIGAVLPERLSRRLRRKLPTEMRGYFGQRERFLAAGFDGYLPKPIDIRALPDQVRVFIEQGRRTPPAGSVAAPAADT